MAVDMKDIIIYFDIKNKGDWDKVYRDIAMKKKVDLADVEKVVSKERKKYNIITLLDSKYPAKYKKDYIRPPFVIRKDKKVK